MSIRFLRIIFLLLAAFGVGTAWAQALSSGTEVIQVQVAASADGTRVPTAKDIVIVTNPLNGQVVGQSDATQQSVAGTYQVVVSNATIAVGTALTLSFRQGATDMALLDASGKTATAPFNASGPFFTKVEVSAQLPNTVASPGTGSGSGSGTGSGTGTGTGTGSGTGTPSSLVGDINGDGVVDQKDVQLLKDALSGNIAINKASMDINLDKVVNTRDLIDLLRALRTAASVKSTSVVNAVRK